MFTDFSEWNMQPFMKILGVFAMPVIKPHGCAGPYNHLALISLEHADSLRNIGEKRQENENGFARGPMQIHFVPNLSLTLTYFGS